MSDERYFASQELYVTSDQLERCRRQAELEWRMQEAADAERFRVQVAIHQARLASMASRHYGLLLIPLLALALGLFYGYVKAHPGALMEAMGSYQ
jgi:hypothetical protein